MRNKLEVLELRRARRLIVLLVATCMACSFRSPTDLDPSQEVLFHTDFVNYAWGFQSSGWYVDRAGQVWQMSPPLLWSHERSQLMVGKVPNEVYAAADLEAEYGNSRDSLLLVLEQSEVREMFGLVKAAAEGSYSDPASTGADGGGALAGSLLYDPDANTYRKIVLSLRGDWTVANQSVAAAALEVWLVDVARRIDARR